MRSHIEFSVTGLDRFNSCERRWLLTRDIDVPQSPSPAMQLGTAFHTLMEARWLGRDWRDNLERACLEISPNWSSRFARPGVVDDAAWLANRHEKHYPSLPKALAVEVPFDLQGPGCRIRGRMDGLVVNPDEEHPGLWGIETKTFSKWNRCDYLQEDPQPWVYMWALQEMGFDPQGILWDGAYSYRWKEDRPVAESFRRLWLPYDQGNINRHMAAFALQAERAASIGGDPKKAVPSYGRGCLYCPVYQACMEIG